MLKPKPTKETACFQRLLPPQKTKSFKDKVNGMTELKIYLKLLTDKNAQLVTACMWQ